MAAGPHPTSATTAPGTIPAVQGCGLEDQRLRGHHPISLHLDVTDGERVVGHAGPTFERCIAEVCRRRERVSSSATPRQARTARSVDIEHFVREGGRTDESVCAHFRRAPTMVRTSDAIWRDDDWASLVTD
jgi:hypothetical protein